MDIHIHFLTLDMSLPYVFPVFSQSYLKYIDPIIQYVVSDVLDSGMYVVRGGRYSLVSGGAGIFSRVEMATPQGRHCKTLERNCMCVARSLIVQYLMILPSVPGTFQSLQKSIHVL